MSSWLSNFNTDKLKEFTEKVQSSLPKLDKEMFEKLTLTTPELTAERKRIDQEELRKEQARDSLAGMLPWETKDPERDILVEECKEAILKLSGTKETFFGPYQMPAKAVKTPEEETEEHSQTTTQAPSEESLEKLQKLQPLPPLLQDFNLDAHVGLINRLLKEDPNLVEMQSKLSGGGERETVFWHNYFFHCAFTRYEAGLSIDEIWSDQPFPLPEKNIEHEEETITFDQNKKEETTSERAFQSEPVTEADAPFKESETDATDNASTDDFDILEDTAGVDDATGDYELDELEAEIARELED